MNFYKLMPKRLRKSFSSDLEFVTFAAVRRFHTSLKVTDDNKPKESPLKKLLDDAASFEDASVKNTQQQWATLPYREGTKIRKQGEYFAQKSKADPRDTSIILFPGQGSQFVGMTKELMKFPMVQDLFELANYILQYDLLKICQEGPKEMLDQTQYSQPAIMVTSLAAIERLKEERPNAVINCVGTAGFSIGEITALVFAGAIGFERALQLVKIRGEAMQLASEANPGGMVTVMYGPDSKLNQACLKAKAWAVEKGDLFPECKIANYLYPHCKVVAGSTSVIISILLRIILLPWLFQALDYLEKNAKQFNLRRVKKIPVSGGFHSDLMLPAVEPFKKALQKTEIHEPAISVYSNIDGKRYQNAEQIRRLLPKQIVKPVKWEQLLHVVYERDQNEYFPRTFECGPGSSLKTILKQVNTKAWSSCINIEV